MLRKREQKERVLRKGSVSECKNKERAKKKESKNKEKAKKIEGPAFERKEER